MVDVQGIVKQGLVTVVSIYCTSWSDIFNLSYYENNLRP